MTDIEIVDTTGTVNDDNRETPRPEMLGNLSNVNNNGASLQESFRKFLDQKKKERQIMKLAKNGEFLGSGKRSEEFKDALRMRFVETAKRYLGVPYAERFKAPDAPIAPLYLDCCGLIRQAVQDLQEDFGFVLGRWNQAYQMDTLPVELEQHNLKPGDLIFYEGIYNSKRSKPQKHNNVHVEIFIGGETGEATIGSRYHKGNVSIFPSFKFKSTTWDLVRYHFRSLDTWLEGECRSHCPEHPWQSDLLGLAAAAGKRSIFNSDSDDDVESAGGDDEEEEQEGVDSTGKVVGTQDTECTHLDDGQQHLHPDFDHHDLEEGVATSVAAASGSSVISSSVQPTGMVTDEHLPPIPRTAPSVSKSSELRKPGTSKEASAAPVAVRPKDKDRKPLRSSLSSLPAIKGSSSRSASPSQSQSPDQPLAVRGVRRTSSQPQPQPQPQPQGKAGAAVCIRSHSVVTAPLDPSAAPATNATSTTTITAAAAATAKTTSPPSKKSHQATPRTYFVGKSNGWRLVKEALDKRGWQQLPFEYDFSSRFDLKWVERRTQIDYRAHVPGQLVNHVPNNDVITTKTGLLVALREQFCRAPLDSAVRLPTPWLPETYQLESPADCIAILEADAAVNDTITTDAGAAAGATASVSPSANNTTEGAAPATEGSDSNQPDKEEAEKDKQQVKADSGCMWIYKPSCYNRGRGIRVVRGRESLELLCYGKQTGNPETTVPPSKGIVQRYIEDPLLVGAEGFKFDVRCYLLIARNDPSYLAYYHPGYCRLSLKPYSTAAETLDDPTVHLTNASIQKKDPIYETHKEEQIRSIESVAASVEQLGNGAAAAFMRERLDSEIMRCMVDVLKAAIPKLVRKKGYFDLLGFDFMITRDGQLRLIEVNTNPALSLDNAVLSGLLPGVVDGSIELVLRSQGPDRPARANDEAMGLFGDTRPGGLSATDAPPLPGAFRLIFSEGSPGYQYQHGGKQKSSS